MAVPRLVRERVLNSLKLATIMCGASALAGCGIGILAPAGRVSRELRVILLDSLVIMLAIIIPTIIVALAFAWWFRESNSKARYRPNWAYSGRLELLIWSIPTLVILFLGGVIWIGSHDLDPAKPLPSQRKPLQIQVVSLDWKWLFIYPEQRIAAVNQVVVPAGQPLHFSLTSGSVMNMFFVPQLGSMIATMNRMETQLHLEADRPGEYYGQSTQFSGDGFSDMNFVMRAVSSDQFDRWVENARQNGPSLNRESYVRLAAQSTIARPFTYKEADPRLFHAIVTQQVEPGPGPDEGRAGAMVHPQGER